MLIQWYSVEETIKKVGLEKLISIGEIIYKHYGDLTDTFSEDIGKYCQIYLDDIVIYSKTMEGHVQHVLTILKKLIKHKLVAKMSKYELHKPKISFLGHVVSKDGM